MNILFFGSDRLLARIRHQTIGQHWELFRVSEPDEIRDFEGTHEFQGALVGTCPKNSVAMKAIRIAKEILRVPVVIVLTPLPTVTEFGRNLPTGSDVVLPDCGNDSLTKLHCDTLVRFANDIRSEDITSGDVTFHTARNAFSVNGQDIHLPRKQHQLLELLFLRTGQIVTTEMVFNQLYGWDEPPSRKTVDVFVCHIRRKLKQAGSTECCIRTVWGQGYSIPRDIRAKAAQAA